MKYLVIGLGSMGKRRVRNLQSLGEKNIAGFDLRSDRRDESMSKYGITTFADFDEALVKFQPEAMVISVSPESHMLYAFRGLKLGISCFIEASVIEADKILSLSKEVIGLPIVMAPSCTLRYFPGPRIVKEVINSGRLGKVLNINYQAGQYLPDWHPWENINDYYVSRRETGGGREIVPFELTWINEIFGKPTALACVKTKLTNMPADIDDIYHCILSYPNNVLANITVEVISRPVATRELRIICSEGELVMSSDESCVRYSKVGDVAWTHIPLGDGTIEHGYINPEEPYISEMADFVTAAKARDSALFPNSLRDDWDTLQVLYNLEKLAEFSRLGK